MSPSHDHDDSFSGRFVLRVSPELHEQLWREALQGELSLNQICVQKLEGATQPTERSLRTSAEGAIASSPLQEMIQTCRRLWGEDLAGLIWANSSSSVERHLKVVFEHEVRLTRKYGEAWQSHLKQTEWTPDFVRMPTRIELAGDDWFETAIDGIVFWEKESLELSRFLGLIRGAIARSEYQKKETHWARRGHTDGELRPEARVERSVKSLMMLLREKRWADALIETQRMGESLLELALAARR